jgi:hypothetical protein
VQLLRGAGYVAAAGFAVTTVLYLLDATDALHASPNFHPSRHGQVEDEATYFAAFFNHQHAIWWDIATRDTVGPIALLSLTVVGICLGNLWDSRRPALQLAVALVSFGAVFGTVNSLLYLGELNYWRHGGWSANPAFGMVAIGRSAEGIDHLTVYPEAWGYTLIAAGVLLIARVGRANQIGTTARLLGYAEAICLIGLVLGSITGTDLAYQLFAVAAGLVVGPSFLTSPSSDQLATDGPSHRCTSSDLCGRTPSPVLAAPYKATEGSTGPPTASRRTPGHRQIRTFARSTNPDHASQI